MDVVVRPVNDRFLTEVLFPAFEQGMADAVPALQFLSERVQDNRTHLLIETLLGQDIFGNFLTLNLGAWFEAAYRLLFWEWSPSRTGGWGIAREHPGFAAGIDDCLHWAMMIEDPQYPYWDATAAAQARALFFEQPALDRSLSAFICGRWDQVPAFAPDQVLATAGREVRYDRRANVVVADWTYRPAPTVTRLAAGLPKKLAQLLERESERLRPIAIPEHAEIYDYWMGRKSSAPLLTVAFSGLGTSAQTWVHDVGAFAKVIRGSADLEQGLTAILVQ